MPINFSPKYKPKSRALRPDEMNLLLGELTEDYGARVAFIVATSANWSETEHAEREDIAVGSNEMYLLVHDASGDNLSISGNLRFPEPQDAPARRF